MKQYLLGSIVLALVGCSTVARDSIYDPSGTAYVSSIATSSVTAVSSTVATSSTTVASSSSVTTTTSTTVVSSSSVATTTSTTVISSSVAVVASSSSVLVATGAVLWDLKVPNYEVQTPSVVMVASGVDIFTTCGGWWMWDSANGGTVTPSNSDHSLVLIDTTTGTFLANGNITSTGLKAHIVAPAATSTITPGLAFIYFDFNKPASNVDISAHGGYAITYTSTCPLQLELKWDEATYGFDTWFVSLPVHTTSSQLVLPWASFHKDGWSTGTQNKTLLFAEQNAWGLRVRLKNFLPSAQTCDFELQSLRWVQ